MEYLQKVLSKFDLFRKIEKCLRLSKSHREPFEN